MVVVKKVEKGALCLKVQGKKFRENFFFKYFIFKTLRSNLEEMKTSTKDEN